MFEPPSICDLFDGDIDRFLETEAIVFGDIRHLFRCPICQACGCGTRGDVLVGDKDLQHKLIGHSNWIWKIAFSPDGQTLASASQDRTIRLWDVTTGAIVSTVMGHFQEVFSIKFRPDSRSLEP